jgi:hypothetical protein
MTAGRISDDEIVYRRIPPMLPFFEEPDRVTTQNFKLDRRRNEFGLSVYRESIVTAAEVLNKPDAIAQSKIASARVGDIRQLQTGDGKPLELDVIVVDDEDNPGHAEIRGPQPGAIKDSASKALQRLFKLI